MKFSQEKCKACHQLGHSCCKTQPIMTENEIAKIYYKYSDLIPKGVHINSMPNSSAYAFIPDSIVNNKNIIITQEYCIFFDQKTSKCKIYEDRPDICREYGYKIPCPFTDLSVKQLTKMSNKKRMKLVSHANSSALTTDTIKYATDLFKNTENTEIRKMPKFTDDYLDHINEDMIMSFVMHYINGVCSDDKWFLTLDHKYHLVSSSPGNIGVLREDICRVNNDSNKLEGVAKLHNFVTSNLLTNPIEYQEFIVSTLNDTLSDVKLATCNLNEESDLNPEQYSNLQYYIFSVAVFRKYLNDFKDKSTKYSNFDVKIIDQILKESIELTGGVEQTTQCIMDNAEIAYLKLVEYTKDKDVNNKL